MILGKWVTGTISAGGSETSEIDLDRDYSEIQVLIPPLDECTLNVKTARLTGGTFKPLDPSVQINAGVGDFHDEWEIGGYQFIKIVASRTQSAARTFTVRGSRA